MLIRDGFIHQHIYIYIYIYICGWFTWTSYMSSEQVNQASVPEATVANSLIKDQPSVEGKRAIDHRDEDG